MAGLLDYAALVRTLNNLAVPVADPYTPLKKGLLGDVGAGASEGAKVYQGGANKPVFYHGSNASFEQFDPSKVGVNTGTITKPGAMWLTSNPNTASNYAETAGKGAQVYPLHVDSKNMDIWDMGGNSTANPEITSMMSKALRDAKRAGKSGVVFERLLDSALGTASGRSWGSTVIGVLSPNSVFSAIGGKKVF